MIRFTLFVITLLIIFQTRIFAQDGVDTDAKKLRNNEVGINVAPAVIVLLGGDFYKPRAVVTYRRLNSFLGNFRVRAMYISDFIPQGLVMQTDYTLISETDSTQTVFYDNTENNNFRLGIGFDRRIGRGVTNKIHFFYGVELFVGLNSDRTTYFTDTYEKDSTNCIKNICLGSWISSDDFGAYKLIVYRVGIVPLIGLKIPLSNRFSISTHLEFAAGYYFGKDVTARFDAENSAFLGELSVFFRF